MHAPKRWYQELYKARIMSYARPRIQNDVHAPEFYTMCTSRDDIMVPQAVHVSLHDKDYGEIERNSQREREL